MLIEIWVKGMDLHLTIDGASTLDQWKTTDHNVFAIILHELFASFWGSLHIASLIIIMVDNKLI